MDSGIPCESMNHSIEKLIYISSRITLMKAKEEQTKFEVFIDRIIPYLVIILLLVIIAEFAFTKFMARYEPLVNIFDSFIIITFIFDLSFKYKRLENKRDFLRKYWLEIIAVFPFYLLFRAAEELVVVFRASELVQQSQLILHEGIELGKTGEILAMDLQKAEMLFMLGMRHFKPGNFNNVGHVKTSFLKYT